MFSIHVREIYLPVYLALSTLRYFLLGIISSCRGLNVCLPRLLHCQYISRNDVQEAVWLFRKERICQAITAQGCP